MSDITSKELYDKLLQYVEKSVESSTKFVLSQDQIKTIMKEDVIPAIQLVSTNQVEIARDMEKLMQFIADYKKDKEIIMKAISVIGPHAEECDSTNKDMAEVMDKEGEYKVKSLIKNVNLLLTGEDYDVLKLVKKLNFWIRVPIALLSASGAVLTFWGIVELYQKFHK